MPSLSRYASIVGIDRDVFMTVRGRSVSVLTIGFYLMEWFIYIGLFIFAQLFRRLIHPRFSDFSLSDPQISHMTYSQRELLFPRMFVLMLTGGITSLSGGTINALSPRYSVTRKWWNTHSTMLTILGTNAVQSVIVSVLKNITGQARPDLITRCVPNAESIGAGQSNIDIRSCGTDNLRALADGFRSFPSGTAATSFSNLTILTFMILSRVNIYQHATSSNSITLPMTGFPILFATLMSMSTLADNRHFLTDTIFGAAIGISSACLIYRQYFPPAWKRPAVTTSSNGTKFEQDLTLAYEPKRFFHDQDVSWKVDPAEAKGDTEEPQELTVRNLTKKKYQTNSHVTV
ncbi:unnamed protein product [Kluyveromyces dobzhanskii CBS 2104]|uniref:WGS project CCBQ000000000 data, contig 00049 n=1 Tax=Kluyveromyces dobzhanskii CBS 2104 TaxID=1427455 RepID=A0A0A8L4S7_9SACH|nr:unnamed protein product [Kluyveromyces dobzhanskii CBS 2104]